MKLVVATTVVSFGMCRAFVFSRIMRFVFAMRCLCMTFCSVLSIGPVLGCSSMTFAMLASNLNR
jgi:hypothetical protein